MTLKRCAHCGGKPLARNWRPRSGPMWVQCQDCGIATRLYDTLGEAEAAWNLRRPAEELFWEQRVVAKR